MMKTTDYTSEYLKKLTTPQKAVQVIKSGDWVDYGWCTNHPIELDKALAARADELYDVKIRGSIAMWEPEVMKINNAPEHFIWNTWHSSGIGRKMVADGRGFFIPMRFYDSPRYYRDNLTVDVAMMQVTPMDENGNFNYGLVNTFIDEMFAKAKVVILEINDKLPRVNCLKGGQINIKDVDFVVEGNNPDIAEMGTPEPDDIDRQVAKHIVELIGDGACLQIGIGGMPNAVGRMIAESDLKDLGVHTEIYVDGFVDLTKAGKITGKRKSVDPGKQVFGCAAGSKKLYDFVHENPDVLAAPVDYTNDIRVIAEIDNFVSINNAINCDLFGEINAETSGLRHISGTGGQLDFMIGAYMSNGGKSFICMSSTYKDHNGRLQSRIMPTLPSGTIVTDPRSCVHYLVTEYGAKNLKGLSTWERSEAIISLAHPDFRDELIKNAEAMHIWRKSNKR